MARIRIAFENDSASILQRTVDLPTLPSSNSTSSTSSTASTAPHIPTESNSTIIPEERDNSAYGNIHDQDKSYSSSRGALHKYVVNARKSGFPEFDIFYDIPATAQFAHLGAHLHVALQLPDYLLPDGPEIVRRLRTYSENVLKRNDLSLLHFFILGDTSYGACCVDEVAAKHLGADAVVHYGHACLQPTASLPVKYVFGRLPLNVNRCAKVLEEGVIVKTGSSSSSEVEEKDAEEKEAVRVVLVLHDVAYSHHMEELRTRLRQSSSSSSSLPSSSSSSTTQHHPIWLVATTDVTSVILPVGASSSSTTSTSAVSASAASTPSSNTENMLAYAGQFVPSSDLPSDLCTIDHTWSVVFIGSKGTRMTRIAMRYGSITQSFFTYDPLRLTTTDVTTEAVKSTSSPSSPSSASSASSSSSSLTSVPSSTPVAMLTKRYWSVQRARDASIIGIVVGTMAVGRYR